MLKGYKQREIFVSPFCLLSYSFFFLLFLDLYFFLALSRLFPPERDGWGTSVLMLAHERGDPRRMFIGGVGGLYRVFKYSGQWCEGVREVSFMTDTKIYLLHGQLRLGFGHEGCM